jgi:phage tail sheath protein FI
VYARIDNQFGVHRPPANAELKFVTDVSEEISGVQQEYLNPYGINAIRAFPGRGIRIWGARSLADTQRDRDWRFIHVRRLMSMIEESIDDSMQWAVFEPNDETLRRTLVHSLSVFLEAIWRQGGLKGAVSAEGFYVKCDETNNPQAVIDRGQLICEVGIAVAAPMEFIIFEVRQQPGGAQIVEL